MLFITGDVSEGSANDALLREVIGPRWRELTGAEQPVLQKTRPPSSPGYLHSRYWPMLMERVKKLQERELAAEHIQHLSKQVSKQPAEKEGAAFESTAPPGGELPSSRLSDSFPLESDSWPRLAARFAVRASRLVDDALGDVSPATKLVLKGVVAVHVLLNYRSSRLIRYLLAWIIFLFVFMFLCIRDLPLCQEALCRGAAVLPHPRTAPRSSSIC